MCYAVTNTLFSQNSHTQHTKQDKIGYMFQLISHRLALVKNIIRMLSTAIGVISPSLHMIIHYECLIKYFFFLNLRYIYNVLSCEKLEISHLLQCCV